MNAEDVKALLAQRHPLKKGWLFLAELRTAMGFGLIRDEAPLSQVRFLDGFAISLWPSKGFKRIGYEVKVARSDWQNELANPHKHMQGYFLTHEFWYVLGPGIYANGKDNLDTIAGCGILEVLEDGTLKERIRAHRHEAFPMPDTFIASMLYTALRSSERYAELMAAHDLAPAPAPEKVTNPATTQQPSLLSLFDMAAHTG